MAVLGFIDPSKVVLTVGFRLINGGFAKGEFATIKRNAPLFGLVVGSSGDASRSKSNDRSAKMNIKLLQTSPFNSYFAGLFLLDQGTGISPFPFSLTDIPQAENHVAVQAWITKMPDAMMSNEDVPRDWEFETNDMETLFVPRF